MIFLCSIVFFFLFGIISTLCFTHLLLKKTIHQIPFPISFKFFNLFYPSAKFLKTTKLENYKLLNSNSFQLYKKLKEEKIESPPSCLQKNILLEEIIENIPFALWFRNTRGKIIYCNKNYAKIFKCSVEKTLENCTELYPPLIQNALKTRQSQKTRRHLVIEKERYYLEIAEKHVGQGLVGYTLDMSEMDEMVSEYANKNYAYENLFDNLASAIAIFNSQTRLILYNQIYAQYFGLNDSFLRSKPKLSQILELLRQENKIAEDTDFINYKKKHINFFKDIFDPVYEMVYQPDGKAFRQTILPYPLGGVVHLFEDCTKTLVLEQKMRMLSDAHNTILNHLAEGILIIKDNCRIQFFNEKTESILKEKITLNAHVRELKCLSITFVELINIRAEIKKMIEVNDKMVSLSYIPLPDTSHLFIFNTQTQNSFNPLQQTG